MKALTLYQPWASLIACGVKTIETRSWATSYRGPLLIHAAKTIPAGWRDEAEYLARRFEEKLKSVCVEISQHWRSLPMGRVVAIADLHDCLATAGPGHLEGTRGVVEISQANEETGSFGPGRVGWMLSNVRAFRDPIWWKGRQGLWDFPDDVISDYLEGSHAFQVQG